MEIMKYEEQRQAGREELADRVIAAVTGAFNTLAAHRNEIRELWHEFGKLQPGETIKGCRSKSEFAETHLHRTDRAVRYMLSGGNRKRPVGSISSSMLAMLIGRLSSGLRTAYGDNAPTAVREAACTELTETIQQFFAAAAGVRPEQPSIVRQAIAFMTGRRSHGQTIGGQSEEGQLE